MEPLDYLVWPFVCNKSCPFPLLYWALRCEWSNNILTRKTSRWEETKAPSSSLCSVINYKYMPSSNLSDFNILCHIHLWFPQVSLLSVTLTVFNKEFNTVLKKITFSLACPPFVSENSCCRCDITETK